MPKTFCRKTLISLLVLIGAQAPSRGQIQTGSEIPSPSPGVANEWLTKAERTDFRKTPRYDETIAYCRKLADHSPWLEYKTFGRSPEGRDLPLLVASRRRAFTPQTAESSIKVFVQNCIHSGECAGKDASLMLLRDIGITQTRRDLLDNITLIVIPIFNVDGHERFSPYSRTNQNGPDEMGWRTTSNNLNLNRDYLKADTVEMRALLKLWNEWNPDFHFDNHTTDGGDWQYDTMLAMDTHATGAPSITGWIEDLLYPHLFAGLRADGHVPAIYFNLKDRNDPTQGISSSGFTPRFSTGYFSLRNRPTLLVEMHALKPYRTRVIGNYQAMRNVLEQINQDPDSLRAANQKADADTALKGRTYNADAKQTVSVRRTKHTDPFTFLGFASRTEESDISGGDRIIYDNTTPVEFQSTWSHKTEPEKVVNPPLAYVIPPQWTPAIELLGIHGLLTQRLMESTEAEVQSYRFKNVTFAKRSYEGRLAPKFELEPTQEKRTLRPGSVIVSLDQPNAKVAMHLFEPDAPDSLVRWGYFNTIFEQKEYGEMYALEKIARDMLSKHPELRKEFDAKIQADEEFAKNQWARLYFFYRRSPYWDSQLNVYPIARLTKPLDAKMELIRR